MVAAYSKADGVLRLPDPGIPAPNGEPLPVPVKWPTAIATTTGVKT